MARGMFDDEDPVVGKGSKTFPVAILNPIPRDPGNLLRVEHTSDIINQTFKPAVAWMFVDEREASGRRA